MADIQSAGDDPSSSISAVADQLIFSVSTVDVDRTTGRIYVSYTDRADTSSADTDVFLRFSDNGGATWSAPVRINDDATTTSQLMPRMSVEPSSGTVCAAWYDARLDRASNQEVHVFSATSTGRRSELVAQHEADHGGIGRVRRLRGAPPVQLWALHGAGRPRRPLLRRVDRRAGGELRGGTDEDLFTARVGL